MIDVTSYAFTIPLIFSGVILVWIFCRSKHVVQAGANKMLKTWPFALPIGIAILGAVLLWIVYWFFPANPFSNSPLPNEVFIILISSLSLLIPAVFIVRVLRISFRSVRLGFLNWRLSITLGVIVSLVLLVPTAFLSSAFRSALPNIDMIYLVSWIYSVFSEELFFRGVMQTRMELFLGQRRGLIFTALVNNIYHAPAWIMVLHMTPIQFIANAILSLPFSILVGYLAQKSNNILGSMLYHVVYDLPFILSM
jgi:membrane protease YdiL (CAAX protease family)